MADWGSAVRWVIREACPEEVILTEAWMVGEEQPLNIYHLGE